MPDKLLSKGSVQFKVEPRGSISAGIGKVSFSDDAILDNIRAFMLAVTDCKPEGFKGKYLSSCHISSSMGPSIKVELPSVDPTNAKFMLDPSKLTAKG